MGSHLRDVKYIYTEFAIEEVSDHSYPILTLSLTYL